MLPSLLIIFREALEATLIIGIIFCYLSRTNQKNLFKIVYLAIIASITTSVVLAIFFIQVLGEFEGKAEYLFEGVTMFIGAFLLTSMIIWMSRQKQVAKELTDKLKIKMNRNQSWGLFSLVFVSILREGIETVIFLNATILSTNNGINNLIGSIIGLVLAIILGFIIFKTSMKVNLKAFFNGTGFLLILFSAGLIAHGIHEFIEAGILNLLTQQAWSINHILDEHSQFGIMLKSLFGYNGNPAIVEVLAYLLYFTVVMLYWKNPNIKKFYFINTDTDVIK